uniref:Telomeric repeat-binding factor 2-interacting protein 1 n=1 Tax=Diabrotica virgifera virgifera TaxID=50390 RepID=A0A6P7FCL6_DIAVI
MRAYTIEEDNLILNWIIRVKGYYHLRGSALWKDMEAGKIFLEDRTWQSLKSRFIKTIQPNIYNAKYSLTTEEKHRIMQGLTQTAKSSRQVLTLGQTVQIVNDPAEY